jgi:hypothetical protein
MRVLLGCRILFWGQIGFDPTQQAFNTLVEAQQVRCGSDDAVGRGSGACRGEVHPDNRNVGAAAVRQYEHEMGFAFVAKLSKDLEHFAFKGMVRADYTNLLREVSDGGSVW